MSITDEFIAKHAPAHAMECVYTDLGDALLGESAYFVSVQMKGEPWAAVYATRAEAEDALARQRAA